MQKSPRSPPSQQSQQDQHQHTSQHQSQTQHHPIYQQSTGQAIGMARQQDLYVSPYWVLGCFSFIGMLFIIFIYFVVAMLSKMQGPSTAQSATQLLRMAKNNNTSINVYNNKINQNVQKSMDMTVIVTQLDQFIKQQNSLQLPIDIFFAKYLYTHFTQNITENTQQKYQQKYYNKLYGDYHIKQGQAPTPFCIVTSQQQNTNKQILQNLLSSIERINYPIYKIVYIRKTNNKQTLKNNKLKNKIFIVPQSQQYIYNQCGLYDIIVKIKIDGNFMFVNRQIFNILNYLYNSENNIWLIYTNGLIKNQNINNGQFNKSNQRGLAEYQYNSLRKLKDFNIQMPFVTFKKQLISKINIQQIKHVSKQELIQRQKLVLYSLIQLSGQNHTRYENIIPYFYQNQQNNTKQQKVKQNGHNQIFVQYLPLESLDDIPRRAPFDKINNL